MNKSQSIRLGDVASLTRGFAIAAACLVVVAGCGGASESDAFTSPTGSAGSGAGTTAGGSGTGNGAGSASTKGGAASNGGGLGAGGGTAANGGAMSVTPPDPTVKEHCDEWCDGVVAADCSGGDTKDDCVIGCRAVSGAAACNAPYAELFTCAEGASFSCNNEGNAVPEGCEVEYGLAGLCLLSNPDETIKEPCEAYCEKQDAAECTNSEPADECSYGCQVTSSIIPACSPQWKKFVNCGQAAEFSCNRDGDPVPAGCQDEYVLYFACVLMQGQ